MKQFASTLLLSGLLGYILPWWVIAPIALIMAFLFESNVLKSFLWSFLAIFMLWASLALFMNENNNGILAERVSKMIIGTDNDLLIVFLTGLIGALVSGFSAVTGSLIKGLIPLSRKD